MIQDLTLFLNIFISLNITQAGGANLVSFDFRLFLSLSLRQRFRPLGYCAPLTALFDLKAAIHGFGGKELVMKRGNLSNWITFPLRNILES